MQHITRKVHEFIINVKLKYIDIYNSLKVSYIFSKKIGHYIIYPKKRCRRISTKKQM